MAGRGSLLYALTWKHWDLPSGPQICALRASARRTSGNGCTGWPTATSNDATGSKYQYAGADHDKMTLKLCGAVDLVGWQTPRARGDAGGNRAQAGDVRNLEDQVQLAGWTTPSSRDWKDTLGMATTGIDPDGTERERLDQLPRQAALVPGLTPGLCLVETESRGLRPRLSPAFTLWMMGLPLVWFVTAPAKVVGKRRGGSEC